MKAGADQTDVAEVRQNTYTYYIRNIRIFSPWVAFLAMSSSQDIHSFIHDVWFFGPLPFIHGFRVSWVCPVGCCEADLGCDLHSFAANVWLIFHFLLSEKVSRMSGGLGWLLELLGKGRSLPEICLDIEKLLAQETYLDTFLLKGLLLCHKRPMNNNLNRRISDIFWLDFHVPLHEVSDALPCNEKWCQNNNFCSSSMFESILPGLCSNYRFCWRSTYHK